MRYKPWGGWLLIVRILVIIKTKIIIIIVTTDFSIRTQTQNGQFEIRWFFYNMILNTYLKLSAVIYISILKLLL